ncbi:serine hydrolase domain-containing protein [Enemella evansiae]|uniref:serine hydrolase domain-containing protein n=1 Tax=Enemella evansiae TaxID=2016499 RepID=UPI00105E0E9B|nr:serine hydrolase domain-containing protein [Enemella evansiae]TDO93298.1 CubicO group peptidase (beta-lactamase class C family) [Enemella evansiae]
MIFKRTTRVRNALRVVAVGATVLALGAAYTPAAQARDFDRPYSGYASPNTKLRTATPAQMGLDPAPIEAARAKIRAYQSATPKPLYPGAVGVMGHDGAIVATEASGYARLYADATTKLPENERVPMRQDTIFDLASVSKLFTSLVVVQLIEEGTVELDAPVARYLPEFGGQGKDTLTVRNLLTHTSALPAWLPLWSAYPDKESRIAAVMNATPTNPPDTVYRYSDLNLIALGVMVERLTGQGLDTAVAERITRPLGMTDTGYNPTDKRRTAATEYQTAPPRGMVWGEVHDENAWSLGGVAGHAGVFSTAGDLAILSQTLLNGGSYNKNRILKPESVDLLTRNFNSKFPGNDHGLGFELNQRWYAEGLSAPKEAGHTGYTGTSIVIDFASRSFAVLLTNRVHPSRDWGSVNPARRDWAQGLALSMPVRPDKGPDAWFTGVTNKTTATLDLPLQVGGSGASVRFDAMVDVEETDPLVLERSTDGGATWTKVPFTVQLSDGESLATDGSWATSGVRRWVRIDASLPAGAQTLRWRHTTDAIYLGRGVYVDDIQVRGGVKVDGEKEPGRFIASNWTRTNR